MNRSLGFLIVCLTMACTSQIREGDLDGLNGYWEIEKVVGPGGNARAYGLNATIDYLELHGLKGFRKKVQPQLDGTFITSDDAVAFELRKKDENFYMTYKTANAEWEEQLLSLKPAAFSVVNSENITYHYKRFQPIAVVP